MPLDDREVREVLPVSGGVHGLDPHATGEALLDLVDPEDARGDGLGGLEDGVQVGFLVAEAD